MRKELGRVRKEVASRFYQLLSGHAATAPTFSVLASLPATGVGGVDRESDRPTPPFHQVQTLDPRNPLAVAGRREELWPPGPLGPFPF